jgi:hypothetical protein
MSERSGEAAPAGGGPGQAPPSGEQRMALVRAFQAQALPRQDPLAANLGVIWFPRARGGEPHPRGQVYRWRHPRRRRRKGAAKRRAK